MNTKGPIVSVVQTSPGRVIEDYGRLLELARYSESLDPSKDTILKLNLSWSLYFPACSTQPWQLEGVIKKLQQDGFKKIHPSENRTVVTDPWKGAKDNKWLPVLNKYNLKYTPLTEKKWVRYTPQSPMLALDEVFRPNYGKPGHRESTGSIHRIPEMFKGCNVIHLPTLKTHGHTTMTGAMKNAFGGLITERRHHCHKRIHEVLVDLLQIQQEIHPGIFAVMDGTVAGDGNGPRTMVPKEKNVMLASADQVAIDAVAAHMMGFDPFRIPFIRMAHERGLGCADVDKIRIEGMPKERLMRMNFSFSTGKSPVIFWDQMLRKGPFSRIEPWLFHTKLFKACIKASELYHDKLWYPLVGRRRVSTFNKSGWGKLWQRY